MPKIQEVIEQYLAENPDVKMLPEDHPEYSRGPQTILLSRIPRRGAGGPDNAGQYSKKSSEQKKSE